MGKTTTTLNVLTYPFIQSQKQRLVEDVERRRSKNAKGLKKQEESKPSEQVCVDELPYN